MAGDRTARAPGWWYRRKRLIAWDHLLFGSIKQEVRLLKGSIRLAHVLAFTFALSIAAGATLWLGDWWWFGGVALGGLVLGRRAIRHLAEHHYKQFLDNFPAYLDRVRKLTEVGNSLDNAMRKALNYAHPRVAHCIAPALRRHELGMPLAAALDIQAKQLGLSEISQLALVAYVNIRYGGSLRDSMAHIAQVERDRARANLELNALTAEVRASAKVFVALPMFVAGAIFMIDPSYVSFFIEDPNGPLILAYCGVSALVGLAIMRRMGRID
jgi:tight adherence protein B